MGYPHMTDEFFFPLRIYPLRFFFLISAFRIQFSTVKNAHHFSSFFCSLSFADFSLRLRNNLTRNL